MDEEQGQTDQSPQAGPDPWAGVRAQMVERQLRGRGLRDPRVLHAMQLMPRERFVPAEYRSQAYEDRALPIGEEQTISQPYMVALMLELLDPQPTDRVLEVGAGSGYQAALLGELAAEVYAVEIVPALARRAAAVLAELGCDNVHLLTADGSEGYPPAAPYDRIIVAAAAPQVPPPLLEQLAPGGRLVAPVGTRYAQQCALWERGPQGLRQTESIGCVFVPLVGKHGWPRQ